MTTSDKIKTWTTPEIIEAVKKGINIFQGREFLAKSDVKAILDNLKFGTTLFNGGYEQVIKVKELKKRCGL